MSVILNLAFYANTTPSLHLNQVAPKLTVFCKSGAFNVK